MPGVSRKAVDSPESVAGLRLSGSGVVGRGVRSALAGLELGGSAALIAPAVVRVADALDAAANAGDVPLMLRVTDQLLILVDRLGLDPAELSPGASSEPVSREERVAAVAAGGPR